MGVNVHILEPCQSGGAQGWMHQRLKKNTKEEISASSQTC
jgi:hypothetical protein